MSGICIKCGKQMKWVGRLWLHCEHCGQLQVWPVGEGGQNDVDKKEKKEIHDTGAGI